jgi:hypothetical protein
VLSLDEICEGLTIAEIQSMSDHDARVLADHMQAVFEMQVPPGDTSAPIHATAHSETNDMPSGTNQHSPRKRWPEDVARLILTKCHLRCCVCPEHRRIADIHHIDGDNTNSVESNGVALCKICHTDAHTLSTMQRNLGSEDLKTFKEQWERTCGGLAVMGLASGYHNLYYMNLHRLDALLREVGEESVATSMPHRYPPGQGIYCSLWPNRKNPLGWDQLQENRSYFEMRLNDALSKLSVVDLALIEAEAVDRDNLVGGLVAFSCQFNGQDIPDQNELVEACGQIEGPPPTMRRQLTYSSQDRVLEVCMMLDPRYMYADSSFIQFSEHGVWSGIARLTQYREAVGSNDGHRLREQIVLTPICIATPARSVRISPAIREVTDGESEYRRLLGDRCIGSKESEGDA